MKFWRCPGRWWCGWRTWCDGRVRSRQVGAAAWRRWRAGPTASTNLRRAATAATARRTKAASRSKTKLRVRNSADVCRCEPEPVCWCGNAAGHTPVHVPASLLELLLFWKVSSEAAKAALKEQNHWNHLMDSVLWSFPTHHYKRSKDVHREKA